MKVVSIVYVFLRCAVIWLCVAPVFAIQSIALADDFNFGIGEGIEYLEDPTHELDFYQVLNGEQDWQVNEDSVFNKGYNPSTWWLKFKLTNDQQVFSEWFLEISYAVIDYLDIYVVDEHGNFKTYQMGDKLRFQNRPIEHRYFVVPLEIPWSSYRDVYIKVRSTSSIQIPLTMWERDAFNAADIGRTAIQGLYYGGLVIIAIYNLLIYLALGERTYLHYVGYVLAMFLFMASLNGWAFQFLWPYATEWNDTAILVSLTLVVFFGAAFAGRFLDLKNISRPLNILVYVFIIFSALIAILCFFIPYTLGIRIVISFAVLGCLYAFTAGVYAWKKGNQSASIYVVAWTGLFVGGIVLALNKVHLLPRNIFTDYATQFGSLMEVVLLSFALAERINKEKALRFQAQQDALTIQQQANEELEHRVAERTLELEEANRKLQELSDTDQLTGLKNRRYLNQYLDKEVARAARYPHELAVLLIDIDHFKSVNDNHGHLVGDDCLQEVAKRISNQMRWPTDLAARYGGEEFCVVLPETDLKGAETVAERIRAKVNEHPVETRDVELPSSVSIGVHVGIPASPDVVNDFLAAADEALYRAKENGRNRVETSSEV
ncbi:MAG: diguanylate cyclase [Pseudomonadales bacterium]|nr:diguanylate cyclase [Pseudomonadales bacterium]